MLDNCEHLVDACAALVETLLRGCHGLRLLTTSRERLGVPGEVAWRVPSLGVPAAGARSPTAIVEHDAVRLFGERARQAEPHFVLGAENAPAVAEICRRLDGIRSPSSWPPRASACCSPRRSPPGWTTGSGC